MRALCICNCLQLPNQRRSLVSHVQERSISACLSAETMSCCEAMNDLSPSVTLSYSRWCLCSAHLFRAQEFHQWLEQQEEDHLKALLFVFLTCHHVLVSAEWFNASGAYLSLPDSPASHRDRGRLAHPSNVADCALFSWPSAAAVCRQCVSRKVSCFARHSLFLTQTRHRGPRAQIHYFQQLCVFVLHCQLSGFVCRQWLGSLLPRCRFAFRPPTSGSQTLRVRCSPFLSFLASSTVSVCHSGAELQIPPLPGHSGSSSHFIAQQVRLSVSQTRSHFFASLFGVPSRCKVGAERNLR